MTKKTGATGPMRRMMMDKMVAIEPDVHPRLKEISVELDVPIRHLVNMVLRDFMDESPSSKARRVDMAHWWWKNHARRPSYFEEHQKDTGESWWDAKRRALERKLRLLDPEEGEPEKFKDLVTGEEVETAKALKDAPRERLRGK